MSAVARSRTRRDWLVGAIAMGIAACSRSRPSLRIAAASSLRDLLEATRADFERAHPGVTLAFSFDASSTLSRQIEHADAFDVFVSADRESVTRIAGRIDPATIATVLTNRLVLVARKDLASPVASIEELATCGGNVVIGGESVPLGRYTRELLQSRGIADKILPHAVSAANARAAIGFVEAGRVDYGFVYATDARASHGTRVVWTGGADTPQVEYVASVVVDANAAANAYRAWLRSAEFQASAAAAGFGFDGSRD